MLLPEKFISRMKNILGGEYDSFAASYDIPPHSAIRINTSKIGAKQIVTEKLELGGTVPWCKEGMYADKRAVSGAHPYHIAGLFYFQEPSAMLAASALPINEGDFVLDLCAAPGGKSTQVGAKLNNTGLLVSNEIVKKRADILCQNIERFGLRNTVVTNETPSRLADKYPEFFDKIIVDAPCSGEGMFKKEPAAVTEWSEEHVKSCAARQKNILNDAVKMLKKGGMLIYSTCTFSVEENEEVAKFLVNEHGLTPVKIALDGISEGIDMPYAARIFPHRQNGEGHFAALFRKDFGGENLSPLKRIKQNSDLVSAVKLYREFESKTLNVQLDGEFYLFGSRLFLLPVGLDIEKIHILRPGLLLGECKKNRFEPSHALALALNAEDFKNVLSLDSGSAELDKYLRGDVLECDMSGYTAVLADGFPIGWGKASVGVMKNHFPKYLRLFKSKV